MSVLRICHNLEAQTLNESKKKLQEILSLENLGLISVDELLGTDKKDLEIYTCHLALDTEIATHKLVSKHCQQKGFKELNPYNEIAMIFDDKFQFYQLLLANMFSTPTTWLFGDEFVKPSGRLVCKPRHGTEKIGFALLDDQELRDNFLINKILAYDDCLIQEYIAFDQEIKILFCDNKIYSNQNSVDKKVISLVWEFIDLLTSYAKIKQCQMPRIFSMDLLVTPSCVYLLEANIRPGALYRFIIKL